MKKFLVLLALMMSAVSVNAADWKQVETSIPNFSLYIDMDSLKPLNDEEFLYAIKYIPKDSVEKVAYIKSNINTNYVGIITAGDYELEKYRPSAVFFNPRVFMKPLKDGSFLVFSHKYVASLYEKEDRLANLDSKVVIGGEKSLPTNVQKTKTSEVDKSNIKPVAYKTMTAKFQEEIAADNLQDYVKSVGIILNKNWNPPKSGRNSRAVVIVSLDSSGGIDRYYFAQKSGDDLTDRSIISAIEKTVPFPKASFMKKNSKDLIYQFVFEYKKFKKSVM